MARERVVWLYNMEYQATFTLSIQYLEDYRQKFAALFKAIRYLHKGRGNTVRRLSLTPPTPPARIATLADPDSDDDEGNDTATAAVLQTDSPGPAYAQPVLVSGYYSPAPETNDERRMRLSRRIINGDPTLASELLPLLPPDEGNLAIEILADVRAYWQGMLSHRTFVASVLIFTSFF